MPTEAPNNQCPQTSCDPGTCTQLGDGFELKVYPEIVGPTHITWDASEIASKNDLSSPVEARIEFARSASADSEAWTVIRDYGQNVGYYTDTQQRAFGVSQNVHYRVLLRDAVGAIVTSSPGRALGAMTPRMIGAFREVVRRWHLRGRTGELRKGFLLKKVRYGNRCTHCRDRDSGVQTRSQCLHCFGVGWEHGYWQMPGCSYAEFTPIQTGESYQEPLGQDNQGPRTTLRMLNIPQIYSGDVWVEDGSDQRWLLGDIVHGQSIGSQELVTQVQSARLDFTNVVYQFPVTR